MYKLSEDQEWIKRKYKDLPGTVLLKFLTLMNVGRNSSMNRLYFLHVVKHPNGNISNGMLNKGKTCPPCILRSTCLEAYGKDPPIPSVTMAHLRHAANQLCICGYIH